MELNEKNKFINECFKNKIKCSDDILQTFILFANGLIPFEKVLEICKQEAVDFKALCENGGLDFNKIVE